MRRILPLLLLLGACASSQDALGPTPFVPPVDREHPKFYQANFESDLPVCRGEATFATPPRADGATVAGTVLDAVLSVPLVLLGGAPIVGMGPGAMLDGATRSDPAKRPRDEADRVLRECLERKGYVYKAWQ